MRKKIFKLREYSLNGAKINSGSISHKSKEYLVTGDNQNYVRLYLLNSDDQLMNFNSSSNSNFQTQVSAACFNSSQDQLYSGSNRGIINVWDITTGKATCTLKGHATSVNCFGIFDDQPQKLASGSYDTHIKLWDIRSKNNTGTLKHHTKQINSIDISPDGRMLISGSQDSSAKLWDLRYPQRLLATYSQHNAPILKVKFNPEDCMFASSSTDRTAKYFRCENNHYNYISSTEMVSTPITAIQFSQDGRLLYTAANDLLKIWNMGKNGLLIDQIEASWKNVLDICCIKGGLIGISSTNNYLSVWVSNFEKKPKISQVQGSPSTVLPLIKNKSRNVQDMKQALNNINYALEVVNNLDNRKQNQLQYKRIDPQKNKIQQLQKQKFKEILKQNQKQKQKQKQRQKQKQKQRQLRKKIQRQIRQQQQRLRYQQQQKLKQQQQKKLVQKMVQQRMQRQKQLQIKLKQTFQENKDQQLSNTIQNDILEHSSLLNISAFMGDGVQKQKLRQMELIGQILKDNSKFQQLISQKAKIVKPIIHYWKQGKIKEAIYTLNQVQMQIFADCISAIVYNPKFKSYISPQAGVSLLKKLAQMMQNKHSTHVKNAMNCINEIVLMFKDQLIKVKTFNPISRGVDLARQQRLAKYDLLIDQFYNIFKQERLQRYAKNKKNSENQEVCLIAAELHKNLQQILRKITPKKQPQAV